ncbi:LOW QUALITY PROTEIN: DUF4283 domain-containing protein, partial [Cephalotus follicularis]
ERKWGKVGSLSFHATGNGVFLVKFDSLQARDWEIDNGPWDVWGYHLVIRKWSSDMPGMQDDPVWVKLSGVPVQYWMKLGLSHIASVIGKPLYMDVNTTKRHSLSFARICIEIDATSSFRNRIVLELENGCTTKIGIEYPCKPAACNLCKVFDHSNKTCPKAVRREWMPRPILMAQRKPDDVDGWITVTKKGKESEHVPEEPHQLVLPQSDEPVRVEPKEAPKTPIKCMEDKVNPVVSLEPSRVEACLNQNTFGGELQWAQKEEEERPRGLRGSSLPIIQMTCVAAWNVRGLNDPSKQNKVRHFLSSNNISLIGILETKFRKVNLNNIVRSINRNWCFISNHDVSIFGRIIVMWDAQISFVPLFVNEQAIHGEVCLPNNVTLFVSFVYGLCDREGHTTLWEDLMFCASQLKHKPWAVLGDFNVTRYGNEHSTSSRVTKAMKDFNNTITKTELEDLSCSGFHFTWSNMRMGEGAISKQLDRALGNWHW